MRHGGDIVSMDATASVEELAQGLDWVQWLLRSVRQRSEGIVVEEQPCIDTAVTAWRKMVTSRFSNGLGQVMLDTLSHAGRRDVQALHESERTWAAYLNECERERSAGAGGLLLSSVRGARHAGVLHTLQESVNAGTMAGHIGVVWPVVASVFQLSASAMLAEYLRLEIQCASKRLPEMPERHYAEVLTHAVKQTLGQQIAQWRGVASSE